MSREVARSLLFTLRGAAASTTAYAPRRGRPYSVGDCHRAATSSPKWVKAAPLPRSGLDRRHGEMRSEACRTDAWIVEAPRTPRKLFRRQFAVLTIAGAPSLQKAVSPSTRKG